MQQRGQERSQPANIADIMVQGAARLVELQASTARALLRAQGRSAALFGAPDWTQMLGRAGADNLSELFITGAQQALNLMRHTNETLSLVQQQVGQLVEQQTAEVAQQMRQGVEEVSQRTEQTLDQMRQTTQQAAQQAAQQAQRRGQEGMQREEQVGGEVQQGGRGGGEELQARRGRRGRRRGG